MELPEILGDDEITKHELTDGDYDITGLLQAQVRDTLREFVELESKLVINWNECPYLSSRLNQDDKSTIDEILVRKWKVLKDKLAKLEAKDEPR